MSSEVTHTLMGQPFTLLNKLRLQGQSHEVTTRNETCILLTEEKRRLVGRDLIGHVSRLVLSHAGGE